MKILKKIVCRMLFLLYNINNKSIRKILQKTITKLEGGQMESLTLRKIFKEYHNMDIGIGTYGSCFNLDLNWAKGGLRVGKYCSFASHVSMYSRNHPCDFISTHPYFYNKDMGYVEEDQQKYHCLEIGNDVWIGQNVVILPSCKQIGDGAVIGAGSIVTHDIPAYAIVTGVPAKVFKYRFNEIDINYLKEQKWWDANPNKIKEMAGDFTSLSTFKQNW